MANIRAQIGPRVGAIVGPRVEAGAASGILLKLANGTFSRSSDAYALGSDSLLDVYPSNELRTEYRDGLGLYLLEGERTNLLTRSEEFDHADWDDNATANVTANTDVSPDGNQTADTLTDSNGSGFSQLQQSVGAPAPATYTLSAFVKKDSDETRFPQIRLFSGGSNRVGVDLNTATGATAAQDGGIGTVDSHGSEDVGDYWRVWCVVTLSSAGSDFEIFPAAKSSLGGAYDSSATGSIVFWGAQLEESSFPTSYIKTVSTTATRAADSLTFSAAEVPEAIKSGRFAFDVYPYMESGDDEHSLLGYDTDSNDLRIYINSLGNVLVREIGDDNTVFLNTPATFSRHQKLTLTIDFPAETVTLEGFTTGNGTFSMAGVNKGNLSTLYIGHSGIFNDRFFGRISNVRRGR